MIETMLTDRIITKALSRADSLVHADRSRCVRMRFSRNTCSYCTATCAAAAISFDGGIMIDGAKCTGCMLCVSECPSGCLSAVDEDFAVLLSKVRKAQDSVPACVVSCKSARNTSAHVKTCCLGFLSEEHLIALTECLDKSLSLNLTACGTCRNSSIVEKLKDRVQSVQTKTSLDVGHKLLLTEKTADLAFEEVSLDRRGFFQALKKATFTQVAGLLDEHDAGKSLSYSVKSAPLKRDLLNRVIRKLSDGKAAAAIISNYAFTVKAGPSCTTCSACVGMCPTGALKVKKDADGAVLLFNSSLCNGCALCKDFCPTEAVTVTKGYAGKSFFEHGICHADAFEAHAAAGKN